ncbi:MAG TPA: hypothetical protein VKA84_01075 [Gemmatimonadaceae bacterium]|nr:hypothetical protein [Gemmatimonadaceae bacterium]
MTESPVPLPGRSRPARIAIVTAGLSAAGALVGGACAAVSLGLVLLCLRVVTPRTSLEGAAFVLAFASLVGAVTGAVGAPLIGWGLLRRVPLGRAIAGTALGTVAGGAAGWAVMPVLGSAAGALLGFVAGAVYLRLRTDAAGHA